MRLSNYHLPMLKNVGSEIVSASHKLCLRAGMIKQCGSGIYTWLPLGLKVMRNIESFIRKIMELNGINEVLMPCIQQSDIWKESGRYDSYGKEMLTAKDRHGKEVFFGPTHEEMATDLIRSSVRSYKHLPLRIHQIQWKFRDEIRPKGGLMRAREFLMNDAYSFDIDPEAAKKSYALFFKIYLDVFAAMGLKVLPVRADSGSIGGDLSHEFHLLCDSAENDLFYDPVCMQLLDEYYAGDNSVVAKLMSAYSVTINLHNDYQPVEKAKGIEVGHVFYFGTKYSKAMGAKVNGPAGELVDVHMGSYGIGVSRLLGAIIEVNHDEKGIKWPEAIAPFKCAMLLLKGGNLDRANNIYKSLRDNQVEVLYDDTDDSSGVKFSRADLMGLPVQIVIGERSGDGMVEFRSRVSGKSEMVSCDHLLERLLQR